MGLSDKEKEVLARLQKKADEPDAPPVSRSIRANIDLGDAKQVELAKKHGFLAGDDDDDDDDDGDDDDKEKDEKPKRRGYFNDEGDKS